MNIFEKEINKVNIFPQIWGSWHVVQQKLVCEVKYFLFFWDQLEYSIYKNIVITEWEGYLTNLLLFSCGTLGLSSSNLLASYPPWRFCYSCWTYWVESLYADATGDKPVLTCGSLATCFVCFAVGMEHSIFLGTLAHLACQKLIGINITIIGSSWDKFFII